MAYLFLVRRMAAVTLESHDYSHLIGSDLLVGDSDNQSFAAYLPRTGAVVRQIALELQVPAGRVALNRTVERFPYVPSDPAARDDRCFESESVRSQYRHNLAIQGVVVQFELPAALSPSVLIFREGRRSPMSLTAAKPESSPIPDAGFPAARRAARRR